MYGDLVFAVIAVIASIAVFEGVRRLSSLSSPSPHKSIAIAAAVAGAVVCVVLAARFELEARSIDDTLGQIKPPSAFVPMGASGIAKIPRDRLPDFTANQAATVYQETGTIIKRFDGATNAWVYWQPTPEQISARELGAKKDALLRDRQRSNRKLSASIVIVLAVAVAAGWFVARRSRKPHNA